jgi:hypothetical protein
VHPSTVEINIAGRTYSLVERTQGQHYTATLESDEGKVYTVHCHHGSWVCNCPDQKYRRPAGGCKHVEKLRERQEERAKEEAKTAIEALSEPTPAADLPPEQQPGVEARRQYQESLSMPTAETTTPDAVQLARVNSLSKPAPPAQQSLSSAFSSQSGRTQLCIALAKAQSAVGRLAHDSQVAFKSVKYDYTSSEAIIEAAKKALGDNGLALLPLEETLNGHEREGVNRYELECKFVLLHQSGEVQALVRHWPVCIGDGRPLDKATAAASTLCLAYLLRDLLLIPRVNPVDDVNQRDDTPPQQQAQRPAKPQKPAPPVPPKNGTELEKRLRAYDAKVSAKGLCKPGELFEAVLVAAGEDGLPPLMKSWDEEQCRVAMDTAKAIAAKMKPAPANAWPVFARLRESRSPR